MIYCSITGFGLTGLYAEHPGYDGLMQAIGGVMSLSGEPDGLPHKVGFPVADLFAGSTAALACWLCCGIAMRPARAGLRVPTPRPRVRRLQPPTRVRRRKK